MNIAPDAETLAEIGRATAQSARAFGHEPRVAFLSFSTRDSAKDASIDRVKEAVALVRAGRARAAGRRRAAVRRGDPARGRDEEVPGQPARGPRQRLHLPRPQLGQHRLQDHGAARRRPRDRPDPPGPEQARERRLARLLGPGLRGRRRDHGAPGAGPGVGPAPSGPAGRPTGPRRSRPRPRRPSRRAGCGGRARPAAKPASRSASRLGRLEAAGRADEQQQRREAARPASEAQGGVPRRLQQDDPPAVERPRDQAFEGRGRRDVGHDGAAALLGGAGGHALPALAARAVERRARGGVGAERDHRPDLGDAELGRLLDDELHAVALEGRHGEHEAQRRLGAGRDGRARGAR